MAACACLSCSATHLFILLFIDSYLYSGINVYCPYSSVISQVCEISVLSESTGCYCVFNTIQCCDCNNG
jgi:hypothetical protein